MANQKVYLVIVSGGLYDSYFSYVVKVFKNLEDAEKYKKAFDEKHVISSDNIFNIIPQDIFMSWDYNDEKEDFALNYKGYTVDQYRKQEERWHIAMDDYRPCEIKIMELEESFDGEI